MSEFLEALRKKYRTPQEALAALGLDAALLDTEIGKGKSMQTSAIAIDQHLRRPGVLAALRNEELRLRRLGSRLAMDEANSLQEMMEHLSKHDKSEEPGEDDGLTGNAGIMGMSEPEPEEEPGMDDMDEMHEEIMEFLADKLSPEDLRHMQDMMGGGEEMEEPYEGEMDWARDRMRRADDAKKKLGRDETEEERKEREEREEGEHAKDRMMRRAEDAKKRLGRDESEEERREREMCEHASDVARDAMHRARDMRRHARDRMREASDRRRAMDFRHRTGRDMSEEEEAEDKKMRAEDRMRRAEDRRMKRAEDRKFMIGGKGGMDKRGAKDGKGAKDTPPPFKGMPQVGKGAMDEATIKRLVDRGISQGIASALKNKDDIYAAREKVRPIVGELPQALAMDDISSPADVYRHALEMQGINTKGIHPSAYEALLDNIDLNRARTSGARLANDSYRSGRSFEDLFPGIKRVRQM